MNESAELGASFDKIATDYKKFRASYPKHIVDVVWELAELPAQSSICEVGCGTGQLSGALAKSGHAVTCVEPGSNLLQVARSDLAKFSNVSFVNATFEDAPLPANHFDLVVAAQSFHWVRPEVRLEKVHEILRDGGVFVAFWVGNIPSPETEPTRSLNELFLREIPGFEIETREIYEQGIVRDFIEMFDSNLFHGCELRRCREQSISEWSEARAKSAANGTSTWSKLAALPSDQRERVVEGVHKIFHELREPIPSTKEVRYLVGRKPAPIRSSKK